MRAYRLMALAPFLIVPLAGCGEGDSARPPATTATTEAAPPEAATTAPPPARTAQAPNAAPPATMTMPPAHATTPSEQPAEATGSVGASSAAAALEKYSGRAFTSGTVAMKLDPDGTFEAREENGSRRVSGQYAAAGEVVTFEPATGDVGWTPSPMRCRLEAAGEGFLLHDVQNSCAPLAGQTFRPAP